MTSLINSYVYVMLLVISQHRPIFSPVGGFVQKDDTRNCGTVIGP